MTERREPRTAAGRALVEGWDRTNAGYLTLTSGRFSLAYLKGQIHDAVIAIEDEAAKGVWAEDGYDEVIP